MRQVCWEGKCVVHAKLTELTNDVNHEIKLEIADALSKQIRKTVKNQVLWTTERRVENVTRNVSYKVKAELHYLFGEWK
jgi:hypothetical protein